MMTNCHPNGRDRGHVTNFKFRGPNQLWNDWSYTHQILPAYRPY